VRVSYASSGLTSDRATVAGVRVDTTEIANRVLDSLSRRDFAALAETFSEDGELRGLVPTALREAEGASGQRSERVPR
jgi:ketosteroid isomerase-like protein